MSVAPHLAPQTPHDDHDHWSPKPLGWHLVFNDHLLWWALGISFVVHLVILAPQYGIKLPQHGEKSLTVSFHAASQRMPHAGETHNTPSQPSKIQKPNETQARVIQPTESKTPRITPPLPSAADLLMRAPATSPPANSAAGNPNSGGRRVTLTPGMKDYRYSQYLDDWRRKVERIGAMNYPEEARGRFFGTLVLSVALRPDGSVDRIAVIRSSGNQVLDDAAKRIVTMSAPFAPFPPDIRKETDYLDITRTWSFKRGDALETR